MDISVVVPLYNEAESLPELEEWIARVMKEHGYSYEILFINDGSTDGSWQVIKQLQAKNPCVKGVCFRRNYGKSPALNTGFLRAEGDVVITMDADLQDSPDEIPALRDMIIKEGYDLVSGWKKKRYDPLSKTIPTKLFNASARRVSGIHNLHDFNCGLKAYRKEVVKHIEVYVGTLWFLSKFGVKPMHFFGFLGSIMFLIGLISVIAVGAIKLYNLYTGHSYILVTDSPYFYLSLTAMILGTQLFLAGFVGELVCRHAPDRNHYEISEEI